MIENRTERVTPEQEEDVISALANFGWQLADAQEIYSESTDIKGVSVKFYDDGLIGGVMQGLTGNDGKIDVNTVKTVTNYVTLHFIRDTSMKYYQTLKEQEEIWAAAVFQEEPKKPVKRTAVCAVGFAIFLISVILALINGTQAEIWEMGIFYTDCAHRFVTAAQAVPEAPAGPPQHSRTAARSAPSAHRGRSGSRHCGRPAYRLRGCRRS